MLVVGAAATAPGDVQSRKLTLEILKFVQSNLALFAQMGVKVRVHKVKKSDLGNAALVEAMKRQGLASLPALKTPRSVYVGTGAIREIYEKNIADYRAYARRGAPQEVDDDLASFYQSEMTFERAAADGDGDGDEIGEGGDLMDAYRTMMHRREGNPGGANGAPKQKKSPAAARREDNVSRGGTAEASPPTEGGASKFEDTFGDGDGLDGGNGAQDDLMEKAYWANQELSM